MDNFLKFPDNSKLSTTDDARLSRLEAGYPSTVAGEVTFSPSTLAVPNTQSVLPSGQVAPTGIQATGSTFAFVVQGNYGFTSTGSSITIYWDGTNGSKLLAIRRADGSNYSIQAGSMTISGLTPGVKYGFASYVAIAQPDYLSFVQGDAGTPQFAFSPSASAAMISEANRTQRLTTNERITEGLIFFTADVGGSGVGDGTYTGSNGDSGGGSGVTQIVAGANISVSPAGGTGVVTINGTGGSVTAVTGTTPIHSSGGATPNITVDVATALAAGVVKPDGTTITIAGDTISAAGAPPTGAAGGDLSGTYPNPGVAKVNGAAVPASATLVGTNSSRQIVAVTTPLAVANGGTGTATPSLVAGANVTISGSWPNQTVAASSSGGTVTAVTGSGAIHSSGGTTPNITVDTATTSNLGVVQPDGTTVLITAGVISAPVGAAKYPGDSTATAAGGESIITFGSTPIANTVKGFLNGVALNTSSYSIATNVITLTAGLTFGVGDVVRWTWYTLNSTPGSITLTAATSGIRGYGVSTNTGGGPTVPRVVFPTSPAAPQAGDLCVIQFGTSDGTLPTPPTGWSYVDNSAGSGTFWIGGSYQKVLSSGDIATGYVDIKPGTTFWTAGVVTFIGAPSIVTYISSKNTNTPVTLVTPGSATTGNTAIYFGSQGWSSAAATGTITFNRGTSRGTAADGTNDACSLYTEALSSSGTVTGIVTYGTPMTDGSHGQFDFQSIIVVNTISTAPGTNPEVQQSQVVGLVSALAALAPMTTLGDMIIGGAAGVPTRLALGSAAQVLTVSGSTPAWASPSVAAFQPSVLPVPPAVGSFTWVNQGAATSSNNGNSILMTIPANASLNWRLLTQSNAYSTPYSIAAFWKVSQYSITTQVSGIYFYDGTKLFGMEFLTQSSGGGYGLRVERINSVTSDNSTQQSTSLYQANTTGALQMPNPMLGGFYGRLRNNGTTLFVDYSLDGSNWINLYSEAVGTFITPTKYGFGGANAQSNAIYPINISLQGWLATNSATL